MDLDILQIHANPDLYVKKYGPHIEPICPEELTEVVKGIFPTKYDGDSDDDIEDIGEVSESGVFTPYTNISTKPLLFVSHPPLLDSDSSDDEDDSANVFTASHPKGATSAASQSNH